MTTEEDEDGRACSNEPTRPFSTTAPPFVDAAGYLAALRTRTTTVTD